jgi:hypothetical protein
MEFMREKEEKKKLEQRIAMLMGQMIRGDGSGGNGPSANNSTGAALPSNGYVRALHVFYISTIFLYVCTVFILPHVNSNE